MLNVHEALAYMCMHICTHISLSHWFLGGLTLYVAGVAGDVFMM